MTISTTELLDIIKSIIKQQGSITLKQYIDLALYHETYGYYKCQKPIGKDGDFITAPEISQMFGEMIAAYFIHYLTQNNIKNFNLIELGPGKGTLMADILRVFTNFGISGNISLVETSPELTRIQQEKLTKYNISWHMELLPPDNDLPTIIFANEFFDAFAPSSFVKYNNLWYEYFVELDANEEFCISTHNPSNLSSLLNEKYPNTIEGNVIEINNSAYSYAANIDNILSKNNGLGLFIDYGYLKPNFQPTIQALYKHSFINILNKPGEADITSHVNFEELALNFSKSKELAITTQGEFLKNLGIIERANFLTQKNSNLHNQLSSELDRLINIEQMGELFKVLICLY